MYTKTTTFELIHLNLIIISNSGYNANLFSLSYLPNVIKQIQRADTGIINGAYLSFPEKPNILCILSAILTII